ncbi:MAG: P27 family phage terminase small subunit [Planctomycetes bacterium]|nr:P27 family phage terminase small subunit [Planctomycetota bacterium]
MKPSGRPGTPIEALQARGSFRADRHGPLLSQDSEAPAVAIPAQVEADPHALACWKAAATALAGALRESDALKLAAVCAWYSRFRLYAAAVDARDPLDPESFKLLHMAQCAWKSFDAGAAEFGLSPSSRARLRIGAPKGAGGAASRSRFFPRAPGRAST